MAEKKDKKLTTASFDITDKAKRFAEEYVYNDGSKTKEECAIAAGYAKESASVRASELTNPRMFPKVVKYIEHLQNQLANKYQVTYGRHIRKLAEIRDLAIEKGNFTSAVAAEVQRGRAAGLYVERKEIRTGSLESLSIEEIKSKIKTLVGDYKPLLDESINESKIIEHES
jgi:phage terminase small subunit|tara:strand:+ start:1288 stop:1800 length:513 start_codon:yes stop_codon:yes gene_type:complete